MTATTQTETPQQRSLWHRLTRRVGQMSLKAKLLSIVCTLLAIGLLISGVSLIGFLRTYLINQVDQELLDNFSQVERYAAQRCGFAEQVPVGPMSENDAPSNYYWSFDQPSGTSICSAKSGTVLGTNESPQIPVFNDEKDQDKRAVSMTVRSTEKSTTQWRILSVPANNMSMVFTIATPLDDVEATTHRVVLLFAGSGVIVVILGSLLGYWAINRSLRPLRDVERTAAAIAAGDLSQRVPSLPVKTEVGHLASALNDMLSQVESSFAAQKASEERMRRFVADASHELRTPLATMRGYGELYRSGAISNKEDVSSAMSRIESESIRMGSLVEDLLTLARLDENKPLKSEPVDLSVLAVDAATDARALDSSRDIKIVTSGNPNQQFIALGDEQKLRQVLTNLVGNAINHTPAGTPIEIIPTAYEEPSGPMVALGIRDHGPGIDSEEASKIFERFYRTDSSRQRGKGGGSGLGLAIVQSIVSTLGGRIAVDETPGGGATMWLVLPTAPPSVQGEVTDW